MNPMIAGQIGQINAALDTLQAALVRTEQRLQSEADTRAQAVREFWDSERRASVLQETYDRLEYALKENERLKMKHLEAGEHARQLLAYSRLLSAAVDKP